MPPKILGNCNRYILEKTYSYKCKKCKEYKSFINNVTGYYDPVGFYSNNSLFDEILKEKIISTKSNGAIFYTDLIKKTKSKLEKDRINKLVDDYQNKQEKKESKNNSLKLRSIDKINRDKRKSMSFWSKYNYLIIAFFLIIIFSSILLLPLLEK